MLIFEAISSIGYDSTLNLPKSLQRFCNVAPSPKFVINHSYPFLYVFDVTKFPVLCSI